MTLLDQAQKLNKLAEVSQVALGMVLAEIKRTEAFKGQYDDFNAYCRLDLGRSKGDVSKLLKVGQFCLDAGFRAETAPQVPYTKLYLAMNAYPDDAKLALSAAATNTLDELENERIEQKFGPHDHTPKDADRYALCECGKFFKI